MEYILIVMIILIKQIIKIIAYFIYGWPWAKYFPKS